MIRRWHTRRATSRCDHRLQFPFGQVGQLQVVEEQVEEFVTGQRKDELIFAVAIGTAAADPAAASAEGF